MKNCNLTKLAGLAAATLLAGCASAPPATQTVYVPVRTPCVKDMPARLEYEFDKLPLNAAAGAKILALAKDWVAGRKYESELEAAIAGVPSDIRYYSVIVTKAVRLA